MFGGLDAHLCDFYRERFAVKFLLEVLEGKDQQDTTDTGNIYVLTRPHKGTVSD